MKIIATSLVIPGLFAAGLVLAPQIASAKDAAPREISGQPIELGTRYELRSAVLGDTREVNVWLPTGYDKSADRYPVVYLLDGGLDQDFVHIAGLGSLASLSWTYGPMIVVGVQTKDRRAELTSRPTDPRYLSAFPESGGADRFRRFLRDEVIPFVEARFRSGDRRALMGESLAGLFVVDTLLNDPTLFGDYVAVSPSLWWDDRRPLRDLDRTAAGQGMSGERLYLAVGDEGGTMQDGIDRMRAYLGKQPPARITVRYADFSKSASHATVYHHAAEEALRWLYPAPPYEQGQTPWFMIEGASPPAAPAH
ncbi:alpha/beta hydrolase [Novosphingobium aerophilum]|uniref:alpha/beta hydrolase n=1 Tax=Novosphingobium TaxID=165696 RepID=UPI002D7848B6|nr:alpha/beta hydrolase-fold protein [Novosphingobium sp. RL4]WRT92600.1 alpha/beta hydrolase-fold protein [Novosphingobium sp. RL4]